MAFKLYKNLSGTSGIKAYEMVPHGINIEFDTGHIYTYTYQFNGRRAIEIMKALAVKGVGLTTYINQEIREQFAERIS